MYKYLYIFVFLFSHTSFAQKKSKISRDDALIDLAVHVSNENLSEALGAIYGSNMRGYQMHFFSEPSTIKSYAEYWKNYYNNYLRKYAYKHKGFIPPTIFGYYNLPRIEFSDIRTDSISLLNFNFLPELKFIGVNVTNLEITANLLSLEIIVSTIKYLTLNNCNTLELQRDLLCNKEDSSYSIPTQISGTIEFLDIQNCRFNNSVVISNRGDSNAKNTVLQGCFFKSSLELQEFRIQKSLELINCTFSENLELNSKRSANNKKCVLQVSSSTDFDHLFINPDNFEFYIPGTSKDDYAEQLAIYQKWLEKFTKEKYEGHERQKLEIRYQKAKLKDKGLYFVIWLQEQWWNFGYNREYIFRNTLYLFSFFLFINLFFLKKLIRDIYRIENIFTALNEASYDKKYKKAIQKLWICTAYSFIIFFGLKLDTSKLNFRAYIPTIYVALFYVIGLICNGFILAYILNR